MTRRRKLGWLTPAQAAAGAAVCTLTCAAAGNPAADQAELCREENLVMPAIDGVIPTDPPHGLAYLAQPFTVRVEPLGDGRHAVAFEVPGGDVMTATWMQADTVDTAVAPRPLVVLVHATDPRRTASRALTLLLTAFGVDVLAVDLPGYGHDGKDHAGDPPHAAERLRLLEDADHFFDRVAWSIRGVRRAIDAAGSLPGVDPNRVHLAGISLGAWVAGRAASIAPPPATVHLILGGADLPRLLAEGADEAARLTERLKPLHAEHQAFQQRLARIDPLTDAHRLDSDRTFVVRAEYDRVVPPSCYDALIHAAGIPEENVLNLPTHHRGIGPFLPGIAAWVAEREP